MSCLSPQRLACRTLSPVSLDTAALKLPRLTALPIPLSWAPDPTYLVAGTGPPARWGYPRNLGHICKEEQSSALSGPRPQGTWCLTVDLGSQKPVGVCPVGGGEARNSGRTLETEEAPTQGLTELRKGSTGQCQQIGQRG